MIHIDWVQQWVVDYYKDFKEVVIDPDDPPAYESQAAYLQRHGLLMAEEKAYLRNHSELLEPEAVIFED